MEVLGALALFVYGSVMATSRWLTDIFTHARAIASGDSEDAMAAMNRAINIGDALVLAMLADGEVQLHESEQLARFLEAQGQELSPAEALERWHARAEALKEPGRLERELTAVAARLSAQDRAIVLDHVRQFAARGSSAQSVGHFREGLVKDPATLVALFERVLGEKV
jgi:hypothetical protein